MNDKLIYTFGEKKPLVLKPHKNLLPSDANHRADLCLFKTQQFKEAAKAREQILIVDKKDAKERKKG